jgi:hypothetical protein
MAKSIGSVIKHGKAAAAAMAERWREEKAAEINQNQRGSQAYLLPKAAERRRKRRRTNGVAASAAVHRRGGGGSGNGGARRIGGGGVASDASSAYRGRVLRWHREIGRVDVV